MGTKEQSPGLLTHRSRNRGLAQDTLGLSPLPTDTLRAVREEVEERLSGNPPGTRVGAAQQRDLLVAREPLRPPRPPPILPDSFSQYLPQQSACSRSTWGARTTAFVLNIASVYGKSIRCI